ncbi:MAG: L-lactate permease [Dehalococcoidales bacterium]|nr:L-lactate permease [Dehalococcoidales bacterium]
MQQIEVNLLLWLSALLPLLAILVLLVGLRWKAASAAPVGYIFAVVVAYFLFKAPAQNIALQTVKGLWDAIFILYVIIPALLLYQISKKAGAFESLRIGIEAYTPNNLLHVLGFGWVFASFLQGITGFGAPVAVTAPLLVAIGVKPLWAVVVSLIGHAWAGTFGTLAVAWEGLGLVTSMDDPGQTALIAAFMLFIANLLAGFFISWLYGKWRGIREALPAVLIISAVHGIGQMVLAPLIPTLANFVPGTLAVGVMLGLARSPWYRNISRVTESQIMEEGEQESQGTEQEKETRNERHMPMLVALAPYMVLIVIIIIVLLIPPIRNVVESIEVGLPFPQLETGLGVVTDQTDAYSAFSPLTHPGTFLLASAFVAYLLFRSRGHLESENKDNTLVSTIKSSIPSAMALFALIPLATVMEGSGQILELALGIASVASGPVYAFLAPFIGSIGAFMTSSNLSSNILFGALQESTALALGIATSVTLAAQTAGAAMSISIAPGNVLLSIGSVNLPGKSGEVIRRTIIYVLIGVTLAGIISLLAYLFFTGG